MYVPVRGLHILFSVSIYSGNVPITDLTWFGVIQQVSMDFLVAFKKIVGTGDNSSAGVKGTRNPKMKWVSDERALAGVHFSYLHPCSETLR